MKCPGFITMLGCWLLISGAHINGQESQRKDGLAEKARQEFVDRKYVDAAKDFRELTRIDPSNIYAHMYLGQSLFSQEKYDEAIGSYEKVRELDEKRKVFSLEQRRILTDQLSMAYGLGGQTAKSRTLLEDAIRKDPEYALNYYNLACAFAESGDHDKVLSNLALAFQRKKNMIKGEQLPDPRSDPSFQKYAHDADFAALMKKLGYE